MVAVRMLDANHPGGISRADAGFAGAISLLHLLVASFYKWGAGVSIVADPDRNSWDWFFQTLPMDLLRNDLLPSIWHLHAQPPLFNLWGGVLGKLFFPLHLEALHLANIGLGALIAAMVYLLLVCLTSHRALSCVVGTLLCLDPGLFLYEAYILYTLPTAFLVAVNVFCLAWQSTTRSELALDAFVASLNLLILTRSAFQAVLLPPAIALACVLANQHHRQRVALFSLLLCSVTLGVYLKNYRAFDFLGTSSWSGMGLWKVAARSYEPAELERLVGFGEIHPMVLEGRPFRPPSSFRRWGFRQTSEVDVLSRDDFHNVNVPKISKAFGASARHLIRREPARYGAAIYQAYLRYCRPSSHFKHLRWNRDKIRNHDRFYTRILLGRALLGRADPDFGTIVFFVLPLACVLYLGQLARSAGRHPKGVIGAVQDDAVMLWTATLILYSTVVFCSFEYGENDRFRFVVEQVFWVFVTVVLFRAVRGQSRGSFPTSACKTVPTTFGVPRADRSG